MAYTITLKKLTASLLNQTGMFRLLRSYKMHDKAVILMYHRVLNPGLVELDLVQAGMYITVGTFRRHAEFLKNEFNVLPLHELFARIRCGQNVKECCAITFDDGWRDNYQNAFPVLLELQLPAIIFLATGFIGTSRIFWPEELAYYLNQKMFRNYSGDSPIVKRFLAEASGDYDDGTFLDNAISRLKAWSVHEREEVLENLRIAGSSPFRERMLMSWEEAREMEASGLIRFGSHTANHVIMDQVSQKHAEAEILQSQHDLQLRLGKRADFFAYPNGNFTGKMPEILMRHGFIGAVTTRKGWVSAGVPAFEIPRIGMHEDVSSTIPLLWSRILFKRF